MEKQMNSPIERSRNTPQLRFPEFQGEWEKKKLASLGEYIGGGTPSTSILEYWVGDIPWISSSDLIEDDIQNVNIHKFITDEAIEKSATKKIPSNSLIIVSRVSVGKFAINKKVVCTSQDFTNIIIDGNNFNANFSAYNLYKNIDILHSISQGTSIKGFTTVDLKNTELSFPSLPEQTKIATFLTAVDEKLQALKKKKEHLAQYKKGVMQKLFSQEIRFKDDTSASLSAGIGNDFPEWEVKKLGEVCEALLKMSRMYTKNMFIAKKISVLHQWTYAIMDFKNSN
jgi:type I restriction enzyme, S subunit